MNLEIAPNVMTQLIEADREHIWHHMLQHKTLETEDPRIIVEGRGMRVWDIRGKEYLDANSGNCWVVNVGYGRERIIEAVSDQLRRMHYFVNSAGSIPGARFADMLIQRMPGMSSRLLLQFRVGGDRESLQDDPTDCA